MAAVNTAPIYVGQILTAPLRNATANTDHTGGGVLQTLLTAITTANGGKGALVQRINVRSSKAVGITTAMVARLWRVAAGGTITLEDELALAAVTPSDTVIGTPYAFARVNILLAAGEALKITQTVAENVDYCAEYGEYIQ